MKSILPIFILVIAALENTAIASGIDAHYQKQRLIIKASGISSPGVGFYQKAISGNLASDCNWIPSDSANAQLLTKNCGVLVTPFRAFARFIDEPDAAYMGYSQIVGLKKIFFKDMPYSCELF